MSTTAPYNQFAQAPTSMRKEAERRFEIVQFHLSLSKRLPKSQATRQTSRHFNIAQGTLYRWLKAVRDQPRHLWIARLMPNYKGRQREVEICREAWDYILADYMRLEAPALTAVYERAQREAVLKGWELPSIKTVQRRLNDLPRALIVLSREGSEALAALYAPQVRDHGYFRSLEAVNADGHRFDVFVRFPDGEVARPTMVAFQDIYSGKMLSWRMGRTENKDQVRLAYADLVRDFGIPERTYLDNGRAFASKWMTGGMKTRFRFKVKDEEPTGLFTQLGTEPIFVTPYHGQAKPIERAFRDLCEYIAKHPVCAGAYTGNSPDAKPENYGSKAVDYFVFERLVQDEIRAHNARAGRRSKVCAGSSFDDAFRKSYEARDDVRRAAEAQLAILFLAAEEVKADKRGAIKLADNTYWTEAMLEHIGKPVVVRFDPDNLHTSIWAYTMDGIYIGEVPCNSAVGFGDTQAAREHARHKKRFVKGVKEQQKATVNMNAIKEASYQKGQSPDDPEPAKFAPAPSANEPDDSDVLFRKGLKKVMGADTDDEDEGPLPPPMRLLPE